MSRTIIALDFSNKEQVLEFLKQFDDVRQKICDDLDKEYADLENRLTDLQSAYYAADQNLIQE